MEQDSDVQYRRFSDNQSSVDLDTSENSDDQAIGDDVNYSMPSQHGAASRPIRVIQNNANKPDTNQHSLVSSVSDSSRGNGFPSQLLRSGSVSSRALEFVASKFAAGSIKGSIFTMCISVVGAGCLALPYAIRNAGLIMGMLLIICCPFLAYFTLDLLLISAEYLPKHLRGTGPERNISYQTYVQMDLF